MVLVSVIGLGSPFGDDNAGWRVVEALAASPLAADHGVQLSLTACRTPVGELPGLLAAADVAIIVDAVMTGGAPGTVYRFSRPPLSLFTDDHLSSHGMGIRAVLGLVQALGDLPSRWFVYGIEVASISVSAATSLCTTRAVARVKEAIEGDIDYFFRNDGPPFQPLRGNKKGGREAAKLLL